MFEQILLGSYFTKIYSEQSQPAASSFSRGCLTRMNEFASEENWAMVFLCTNSNHLSGTSCLCHHIYIYKLNILQLSLTFSMMDTVSIFCKRCKLSRNLYVKTFSHCVCSCGQCNLQTNNKSLPRVVIFPHWAETRSEINLINRTGGAGGSWRL